MRRRSWVGWLIPLLAIVPAPASVATAAAPDVPPAAEAPAPTRRPWVPRRRRGERAPTATGWSLIDISTWPAEPATPANVEPARLATALRALCRRLKPERAAQQAGWIVEYAREFGVDPLLLGALAYTESRCKHWLRDEYGVGLLRIQPRMHYGWVKDRHYVYRVFEGGKWGRRELDMSRFAMTGWTLRGAQQNLYFGAALLAVAQAQCPGIDGPFGSRPHRHPVSHFLWGDVVGSSAQEDAVLMARRRLLEYYHQRPYAGRGRWNELELRLPLDGGPRLVTSGWMDLRDKGKRRHKGIDFASDLGEPVRAVADGTVQLAGADLIDAPSQSFSPRAVARLPKERLGRAGLIVRIEHAGGLVSAYMHLMKYTVRPGELVEAGQLIGLVGRSGLRQSSGHLHFELREGRQRFDPLPHFGDTVIPPSATRGGRWHQRRRDRFEERPKKVRTEARPVGPRGGSGE